MKSNETLTRWLLYGVISIPLPLLSYFYLILHVGFGLPLHELLVPAGLFSAFIPGFAAGAYWGMRAREKGKRMPLILVIGSFALLCGLEFSYFQSKLGASAADKSTYAFTFAWVVVAVVGGYFMDKWINPLKPREERNSYSVRDTRH